jgi:hypothetical protein
VPYEISYLHGLNKIDKLCEFIMYGLVRFYCSENFVQSIISVNSVYNSNCLYLFLMAKSSLYWYSNLLSVHHLLLGFLVSVSCCKVVFLC